MFSDPKPPQFDDWFCIFETSNEQEAQLCKTFMEGQGLEARVLSKKDSAYNLNVGDMAVLFVYVPTEHGDEAQSLMAEWNSGSLELGEEEE